MSDFLIAPAPTVEVRLNGQRLGMTQSFRAKTVAAATAVRSFGARDPIAMAKGKREYVITLKRLVLDREKLPNQTMAAGLTSFSLSLSDGVTEMTFTGCCITSENVSYEAGKLLVEELEVRASGRALTAVA